MSENIYKPPQSKVIKESNTNNTLATRWQRLWAALLDVLPIMVVTLPTSYFTGGFDQITEGIDPPLEHTLLLGILGFFVFFLINSKLLIKNGQTIGKKILGIKIVDLNGDISTIKHLSIRYAVYFLPGYIPVVGQFISIGMLLSIFHAQKRCGHDYIAKTKVVRESTSTKTIVN